MTQSCIYIYIYIHTYTFFISLLNIEFVILQFLTTIGIHSVTSKLPREHLGTQGQADGDAGSPRRLPFIFACTSLTRFFSGRGLHSGVEQPLTDCMLMFLHLLVPGRTGGGRERATD